MRKIKLMLDEDLVSRARRQDLGEADKSDDQVVEDALTVFLGLRRPGRTASEQHYRCLEDRYQQPNEHKGFPCELECFSDSPYEQRSLDELLLDGL